MIKYEYFMKRMNKMKDEIKMKKEEWHYLQENPNYLPKNKEKVLLKYRFSGDDEIHISDGYYDVYDSEFHIANNPEFRIVCVIAWREFPKKENE